MLIERTPYTLTVTFGTVPPVEVTVTFGDDGINLQPIANLIREVIREDDVVDEDDDEFCDCDECQDDDIAFCDCDEDECQAEDEFDFDKAFRRFLEDMGDRPTGVNTVPPTIGTGISFLAQMQQFIRERRSRAFVRRAIGCTDPDCPACRLMGLL